MRQRSMDPWRESGSDVALSGYSSLEFEDNFVPSLRDSLPDSEKYLAALEEKLRKIKNDPNVLKQLAEKKEACMQNLLNGDTYFEEDSELDAPLGSLPILRTILPQKQALNRGEVVELVEYDQLKDSDSEKEQN